MNQYKFFINYLWTRFCFGILYEKGFSFIVYIGFFKLGIGFTETAEGFGIWKA
jgi:hypothetical protein